MKKTITIGLLVLTSFIKMNASDVNTTMIFIPQLDTIIGYFDLNDLKRAPFNEWYDVEYENYNLDIKTLDQINSDILTEVEIKIVIGTWCSDSKRETPRFSKIINYLEIQNITAIGVNRSKKAPHTEVESLDIEFVPTFIFYFEGNEIGRIIESPAETLEKDILNILSGI